MKKRIVPLLTLVIFPVLFSGCPVGQFALVGFWTLTHNGNDSVLELKANGEAVSSVLPPNNSFIGGTLTWEVNGTEFIMRSDFLSNQFMFIGRVSGNGNSMSGASVGWEGPGLGNADVWTAVKQ